MFDVQHVFCLSGCMSGLYGISLESGAMCFFLLSLNKSPFLKEGSRKRGRRSIISLRGTLLKRTFALSSLFFFSLVALNSCVQKERLISLYARDSRLIVQDINERGALPLKTYRYQKRASSLTWRSASFSSITSLLAAGRRRRLAKPIRFTKSKAKRMSF